MGKSGQALRNHFSLVLARVAQLQPGQSTVEGRGNLLEQERNPNPRCNPHCNTAGSPSAAGAPWRRSIALTSTGVTEQFLARHFTHSDTFSRPFGGFKSSGAMELRRQTSSADFLVLISQWALWWLQMHQNGTLVNLGKWKGLKAAQA